MTDGQKSENSTKRSWLRRVFRIFLSFFLLVFFLLVVLVVVLRSQWGQNFVVSKATKYVSNKTQTTVSIDNIYLTLSGKFDLRGLYLADKKGDTLVYSKSLRAAIPVIPIIKGQPISLNRMDWDGLTAHIYRNDSIEGYNFQFLIDAFATEEQNKEPRETTNSAPPEIRLKNIDFSNFHLTFRDSVMGVYASADLQKLHFVGKDFDLNKMRFHAKELALKNTVLRYKQTKPFPETVDDEPVMLPFIAVDEFKLHGVEAQYDSEPDRMFIAARLNNLEAFESEVNLPDQQLIFDRIQLKENFISFKNLDTASQEVVLQEEPIEKTSFTWPDWEVIANRIRIQQNDFSYQAVENRGDPSQFNPNYLEIQALDLDLEQLNLSKNETLSAALRELKFKEKSGLSLQDLKFELQVEKDFAQVEKLRLETDKSRLDASATLQFKNLNDLIDEPENAQIDLSISDLLVDMDEVFTYLPELRENEYLKNSNRYKLIGKLEGKGTLQRYTVNQLNLDWGKRTQLFAKGQLTNLLDTDRLGFDLTEVRFQSYREEVLNFIQEEDFGFRIPDTLRLESQIRGNLQKIHTESSLLTSSGTVRIKGDYENNIASYNADLEAIDIDLAKLLGQEQLGSISLHSEMQGEGKSLNDLSTRFYVDFSKLDFNEYDFSPLQLSGELEKGIGNVKVNYQDENLDLLIDSKVNLDSIQQVVESEIQLNNADLKRLNFYKNRVKTKLAMTTRFENRKGDLNLKAHIEEAVANYQDWDHHLGELDFEGNLKDKETSFWVRSNFLNGEMSANANPRRMGLAFKRQLRRYFTDSIYALDSIRDPLHLKMDLKLNENALVNNVFFPEIHKMDTLSANIEFKQEEELLTAVVILPELNYEGYVLNDLFFNLNSAADVAQYILGYESLDAGPFGMYRTFLSGDLQDGLLTTNFFAMNEEEEIFYSAHTETRGKKGELSFHILPSNLMLDGKEWKVEEDNELVIYKDSIRARNFTLSHQDQKLQIANDLTPIKRPQIGLKVENFELQNLLGLFNPDENLASGTLQGRMVVVNPFGKRGLLGDIKIEDLHFTETPLGDLSFRALSRDTDSYRFRMELKGEDTDAEANGTYLAKSDKNSELNLDFNLNKFGFKTIAQLSQNELQNASGYLKGNFSIEGKLEDPVYNGFLQFENASFRVAQTNSKFTLADEELIVNNDGIVLSQFKIKDENQKEFLIDGAILSRKWRNPEFDLKLRTENFQLVNSTAKDNDLFHGKLNFDLFGYIQGKMNLPDVFLGFKINKETDFTYVYLDSQASLEKREGIVDFVDKELGQPMYVRRDSTFLEKIKGIQFHANVDVDKRANFKVVIDPRTGDELKISGEGALDFRIDRSGEMNLTGRYIIDKGYYKMNLYNLVRREFQFKSGSSIIWSGDPYDADLDISARYEVKASAAGLMASESGGIGIGEDNKYKRRLPFIVFLNIGGTINRPDLSFGMDMPEEAKGELGGAVYGKVSQLNEDEGELNRQVFSLLVLRQFFPQGGSDGSSGGFVGVARDNLADALADQLSAFSDELLGSTGVKLNFGLDSYTDYQGNSAQQRTDLSINAEKSLLNDRLIVKAGTDVNIQGDMRPGEERAMLGNVSIEYLLTDDGRWRIRGFRNDEYDNIIDGQVFINGIGLIFQADFNRFGYLWQSFIGNPEKYFTRLRKKREEEQKEKEETSSSKKDN